LYDCAHGAGLAVAMPAVNRFAQIAVRVWNCRKDFYYPDNTAKAGIEAIYRLMV